MLLLFQHALTLRKSSDAERLVVNDLQSLVRSGCAYDFQIVPRVRTFHGGSSR